MIIYSLLIHAYVISVEFSAAEFSAVNRRRPSRETPLGPGAKKDGCFRRLRRDRQAVLQVLINVGANMLINVGVNNCKQSI